MTDGETALVVHAREAEPMLADLRRRFDPAERLGVPPHITLLHPFVRATDLDEDAERRIRTVVGSRAAFRFRLATIGRFPGVAYLAPDPSSRFVALIEALWRAFPEHPPFAGRHATIIPHLTVASGDDAHAEEAAGELEALLAMHGSIEACAADVTLLASAGGRWQTRRSYALGARALGS